MEALLLYFVINAVLALILWWAVRPKVSRLGYALMMLLLGLPVLVLIVAMFAVVFLGGASYNFGEATETWLRKVLS